MTTEDVSITYGNAVMALTSTTTDGERPGLDDRLATPALPRLPLPQPDKRSGAKSRLTANRRRVLTVAH
jgi:hypothetical protein